MNFTFYLFKQSVMDFDDALDQSKINSEDGFTEIELKESVPYSAKAFFQKNKTTRPKWLDYISEYVILDDEDINNTTNSFLLLIKRSGRIFAINQGFGFHALDRKKLETGFGLKVVLNEIDPERIKSLDVRNIDLTTKQKRILVNRDSPLFEFDFDLNEDLLRMLSGKPTNSDFAQSLFGSDSLKMTSDINFLDLGNQCEKLLNAFNKDEYKHNFPFIDYLHVIRDKEIEENLEDLLTKAINERQKDKLILAYPEIPDFNTIEEFKIFSGHKNIFVPEIDLTSIYDFLDSYPTIKDFNKIHVIGFDSSGAPGTIKYGLHDFLVFETEFNEAQYILSLNQWYEVSDNYLEIINNDLENILEIDNDFLPHMDYGQREDKYNEYVADHDKTIQSLDKKNYPAGGYSKIEVCDLITKTHELICVKKYNSSSTLSHLFSQGYVSAVLLNDETQYREFIINKCTQEFVGSSIKLDSIDRQAITFVFAIASDSDKSIKELLPFFSKINLIRTYKEITRMGFEVKVNKIIIGN